MRKKIITEITLPLIVMTAGMYFIGSLVKTYKRFTINHSDYSDYGEYEENIYSSLLHHAK